jgi:RES domain-containing protein
VKVWRIVRPAHAANPLSGAGAARWGNRWNSIGVPMVYASTSRPLALLEMLVHLPREYAPLGAVLVPAEVPDDLISATPEMPEGWNQFPYGEESRRIGDHWVEQGSSLAMFVPSVILPAEKNILINPAHAHFRQITVGPPEPQAFDRRLFGMTG